MTELWGKVYTKYSYDENKPLYDQIWYIVEEKLKWYAELFKDKPLYQEDVWKDWSLNLRFSKITARNINFVNIEENIKNCKTKTEEKFLFEYILWRIPYFVRRRYRPKNADDNQNDDKYINNKSNKNIKYKCPPVQESIDDTWEENDVFEIIGRSPKTTNIELYINNKIVNSEVIRNKFDYIETNKVSRINDILSNNLNIVNVAIRCSANTIRTCENMFAGCKKLIECDLSNINLNYCESLANLFRNCVNLRVINLSGLDLNISDPDISNMFTNCNSLEKIIAYNCSNSTINQLKCILYNSGLENVKIEEL